MAKHDYSAESLMLFSKCFTTYILAMLISLANLTNWTDLWMVYELKLLEWRFKKKKFLSN